jgi:membrane protein YdbS with pleckstrin-like domain
MAGVTSFIDGSPAAPPLEVAVTMTPDWQALPRTAGHIRAAAGALAGLIVSSAASLVFTQPVESLLIRLLVIVAAMLTGTLIGAAVGHARWRRTRWKLDEQGFHVRRGWLWRTEVLVPRSRVQHLDLERGPLERHFGLATLVVHTAGSQTPALRQSGLADADAIALRDALIPAASSQSDAL